MEGAEMSDKLQEFGQLATGILLSVGLRPGELRETVHDLMHYYTLKDRHYHGIGHVLFMLDMAENLGWVRKPTEPDCYLAMAVLYHDVHWFHTAAPGESEVISARICRLTMGQCGGSRRMLSDNYVPRPAMDIVCEAIEDTAKYLEGVARSELSRRLCDLDLASFAKPWEEFCADADAVCREYDGTKKERAEFYARLWQARDGEIYHTKRAQAWLPKAQENMQRYCEEQGVEL